MAVARVTKITASSKKGFEDAIEQGLSRAAKRPTASEVISIFSQLGPQAGPRQSRAVGLRCVKGG